MKKIDLKKHLVNSKLLRDISWTVWAKAVAMLFFFLTDVVIARVLSVDEYGEWTFFYSIKTMLAYLCYFGIDHATKLVIARVEDADRQRKFFRVALAMRVIINLLFAFLICAVGEQLVLLFDAKNVYGDLKYLIRFGGILASFNAFQEFFKAVGYGIKDNKTAFWVTLYEFMGAFVFVFLGVMLFKDNRGVLYGYLTAGMVTLFLSLAVFQKRDGMLIKPQGSYDNKEIVLEILKYALPLLLANIANLISLELDTVMLGMLNGSEQVAMYNIGKKICSKAGQVNLAIATGSMASFAIINAENVKKKLEDLKKLQMLNFLATMGIGIALVPFAIWGVPIIYGDKYVGAVRIMLWFIPFYLMYGTSIFYAIFMDYRGKSTLRSIYSVVSIVLNVVLNYFFIPKYGAAGAVWTTLLSQGPYMLFVLFSAKGMIKKIKRDYGIEN